MVISDLPEYLPLLEKNIELNKDAVKANSNVVEALQDDEGFEVVFQDFDEQDFKPCDGVCVLFVAEAEYAGISEAYKPRVARAYRARGDAKLVVMVERSQLADTSFYDVQEIVAMDLDLPLIPVSGDGAALAQTLASMARVSHRPNPFMRDNSKRRNVHLELVETMSLVPQIGQKRARQLLVKFGSIKGVAEASITDLAKVLGFAVARNVHRFFSLKVLDGKPLPKEDAF